MSDILEFPNYYKQCPKCNSKNIVFVDQDIISIKRIHKVLENGEIEVNHFKAKRVKMEESIAGYICYDCEWSDFGASTWNKKTKL